MDQALKQRDRHQKSLQTCCITFMHFWEFFDSERIEVPSLIPIEDNGNALLTDQAPREEKTEDIQNSFTVLKNVHS